MAVCLIPNQLSAVESDIALPGSSGQSIKCRVISKSTHTRLQHRNTDKVGQSSIKLDKPYLPMSDFKLDITKVSFISGTYRFMVKKRIVVFKSC